MKKWILLTVAILGMSLTVSAATVKPKGGDDLFPWPWGTECPFPWTEIEGTYQVKTLKNGPYNGHFLVFSVAHEQENGLKFLNVYQYDRQGVHYATGQAYSQKDQRILKGVLSTEDTSRDYVLMVRSYQKDKRQSCKAQDLVTAVTFCPVRGRKCLDDANYILQKFE